jgi:hypothetical protein
VADDSGKKMKKWSVWPITKGPEDWDDKIRYINKMQGELGVLNEEVRRLRIQIGSFLACDSGFPTTVDELLKAIGEGKSTKPTFHNGCWMATGERTTQPHHIESMCVIYEVLTSYLEGKGKEGLIEKYPFAQNFIIHTFQWLGPFDKFTKLQKLLMERMLLPFDFYTKGSGTIPHSSWAKGVEQVCRETLKKCYQEGGRGTEIDIEIAQLAELPKIYPNYTQEYRDNLNTIENSEKKELYKVCGALAHGLHTLSDCHHSTFRWIENWIYSIGTGKWGIPTRKVGTERERLGRLLFGYALGIDKWLLDKPMQFVLMDLGHVDLGFNPKNEILRVYAYLGDKRTPVKQWLVACLWYNLAHCWLAGLMWGDKHKDLIERAKEAGIDVNEWMNSRRKNEEY